MPGSSAPGHLEVLLALASSATGVRLDGSQQPVATNIPDLLTRSFDDPVVGLASPEQIQIWKANLTHLLPQFSAQIDALPVHPGLPIHEAIGMVAGIAAAATTMPDIIVKGVIAEARTQVGNLFGKVFADKSSKELLQRLVSPAREAMGIAGAAAPPVVMEFTDSPAEQPSSAGLDIRLSRQLALTFRRDEFLKLIGPVRSIIEKVAGAGAVQVCWLNSSLRAAARLDALAPIADHDELQQLDLPRRLAREINVATATMHCAAFRQKLNVTGRGVRVAVIDGEVNVHHPALAGRVTLQENFTKEAFGNPDAHGTAVAGIIGSNDAQFGGVAPDVTILSYKVFRTDDAVGDEFQGMLAVQHALQDGADIANCSWGTGPAGDGTSREARAFNTAWAQGMILVKSAGNNGPSANSLTAPADADGVIVVAATDREGKTVPDYSSRGPTANGKHPHLAAPGGTEDSGIHTCLGDFSAGAFGMAGFGTSFAAPAVTGAAALLCQKSPNARPDEIRDQLVKISRTFSGSQPQIYGAGILDLSKFA